MCINCLYWPVRLWGCFFRVWDICLLGYWVLSLFFFWLDYFVCLLWSYYWVYWRFFVLKFSWV
ncbi:hypothetical protein BDV34DRAFT_203381, partial [Aspergillus parasiticus]